MEKRFIGIDLGGTNVRAALVDDDGNIIEDIKRPSLADKGAKAVVDNMIAMVKELDYKSALGIGIGVPGPVDTYRGVASISTNVKGLAGYPVAKKMKEALNMPVYMDNDANVAGLAEAVLGAGKGYPIVYYITHSTGIGGALIIDGKTVGGRLGYAGEIGNIIIDRNRKKYNNNLNVGAAENEASGIAIARIGKETLGSETTKQVFDLAKDGDKKAWEVIDHMAYDFAQMMSAIGHVIDPHVYVIGGGVMQNSGDMYIEKVKEYYKSLVHEQMRDVKITKAILDEPGVIGAAMLVRANEG